MKDSRSLFRLAFLPAAIAALVAGCAPMEPHYAQAAPPANLTTFDRLDVNRDGFLSRAELDVLGLRPAVPAFTPEMAGAAFRRLDTNADGFLSRAEAQAMFNTIPGGSFDAADANRDGFLSLAEATPHLRWYESHTASTGAGTFEAYDTDRDGFLSRAEATPLLQAWSWSNGRWVYIAPAPVAVVPAPVVVAPGTAVVTPAPVTVFNFDRLDRNNDGFLSRAEAASIAGPGTFDRFDVNRDGFLARQEFDLLMRNSGVGVTRGPGQYTGYVYGPNY